MSFGLFNRTTRRRGKKGALPLFRPNRYNMVEMAIEEPGSSPESCNSVTCLAISRICCASSDDGGLWRYYESLGKSVAAILPKNLRRHRLAAHV